MKLGPSIGYVLNAKITELSGRMIKAVYPEFRGAHLSIASVYTCIPHVADVIGHLHDCTCTCVDIGSLSYM